MPSQELSFLSFGIATPEEIRANSVVEITSCLKTGISNLYDERMGPLTPNTLCKVCFGDIVTCPGHFGHIELAYPVINPLFTNRLMVLLNLVCLDCGKPLLPWGKRPPMRPNRSETYLSVLTSRCRKVSCSKCGRPPTSWTCDDLGLFSHSQGSKTFHYLDEVRQQLVDIAPGVFEEITGGKVVDAHPANMIMTVLPVLPHLNRPSVSQGPQNCDDDITSLYGEIVKSTFRLRASERGSPQWTRWARKVAYALTTAFDNRAKNVRHPSSGRNVQSFIDRMAGKSGCFRNHCMGRRCNQTARAVTTPGANLSCTQVGLPLSICQTLSQPETVTAENFDKLQALCDQGCVTTVWRGGKEYNIFKFKFRPQTILQRGWKVIPESGLPYAVETGREVLQEGDTVVDRMNKPVEVVCAKTKPFPLKLGDIVDRPLKNGDVVLVNRQPTLHSGSLIAMDVVVHTDYTIKLPLGVTTRLNADFDGDEVNVHAIQSAEGIREMMEKAHVSVTTISPSSGGPMVNIVQDSILACYLMSSRPSHIQPRLFPSELQGRIDHIRLVRKLANIQDPFSGYDTLSSLSGSLPITFTYFTDELQIYKGVWISGLATKRTLHAILAQLPPNDKLHMVDYIAKHCVGWLTDSGFTLSLVDFECLSRDKLQQFDTTDLDWSVLRDRIHAYSDNSLPRAHGLEACVASGSKGTLMDIGRLRGCLGMQQVSSGGVAGFIPPQMPGGRVITHDTHLSDFVNQTDPDYIPQLLHRVKLHPTRFGFVMGNYGVGLTPREFILHMLPSRDSLIDTATGTASTGYMQHKLVKIMDDVVLDNGRLVYNSGHQRCFGLVIENKEQKNGSRVS